jgi:hypothetical protein
MTNGVVARLHRVASLEQTKADGSVLQGTYNVQIYASGQYCNSVYDVTLVRQ